MKEEDNNFTSPSLASEKEEGEAKVKAADLVAYWLREIELAGKREYNWRGDAKESVNIYEAERGGDEIPFNVLFSNTETLAPALYNATPVPVVQRRFKDEDPLGKKAATATERVLKFLIDPGESEHSSFDELITSAVLDALVPGRGITFFSYEPTFKGDGSGKKVARETVCGELVPWEKFRMGYARSWKLVPWISREILYTQEEASDEFGDDIAKAMQYDQVSNDPDQKEQQNDRTAGTKMACVYQIWDRATRKVLWISKSYETGPCKEVSDPLKLRSFFPCPQPLQLIGKVSGMLPVTLYKTYKNQAEELNRITFRINKLISALKVRGMYDSQVGSMADVLKAGDNEMLPADGVATLIGQGSSLEKSLWIVPIDSIIKALQQLYLARDAVKSTIFEINGIADIMRGSTQASETLGAQEIKNQWGTLRLKRTQKIVANYVRECLRIMAEIAIEHFDEKTLQQMTGLPYPTSAQQAKAKTQLLMIQMTLAGQPGPQNSPPGMPPMQPVSQPTMPPQQPQPPQPGQPAGQGPGPQEQPPSSQPPSPPNPMIAKLMEMTNQPSWKDIQDLLKEETLSAYRIDIQTNSTVDAEATEDKQNITDLINAIAQFLNGVAPMVESGSMPFEVAKNMMLTIVRRYRFGPELEDSLNNMQAPQPKPDPKVEALQMKAQMDQKNNEAKLQMDQAKFQMDQQKQQQELQVKQALAQLEMQVAQQELELKKVEIQLKVQEGQLKLQLAHEQGQMKLQQTAMQGQIQQRQAENDLSMQNQQNEMDLQNQQETHKMSLESTKAKTDSAVTISKNRAKQSANPPPKPAGK